MEYPKINTLFKREMYGDNVIIPDEICIPEMNYLKDCLFECTEKIDGTNIRIEIEWKSQNEYIIEIKGRTDRDIIPNHLLEKLHSLFDNFNPNNIFEFKNPTHITLYGEGYGVKIQNGDNYIKNGVDFILFDIKIGNYWLLRQSIEDIAKNIKLKVVPLVGYFTLNDAIEYVKNGFKSIIAENKDYEAEGLVLKTPCGLVDRNGSRIITKLKTIDFRKLEAKNNKNVN